MIWKKLGLVYTADKDSDWMFSHAAVPFASQLADDIFRIYFSPRDKEGRSNLGYVDINLNYPNQIINISKEPLLTPGGVGSFDERGVTACCQIVSAQGQTLLYYTGWSKPNGNHYKTAVGVAVKNGEKFEKLSTNPLLDTDEIDQHSIGFLYIIEDSGKFKMWYESNLGWKGAEKTDYLINLSYAESIDGLNWQKISSQIIPLNKGEYVISRPAVIKSNSKYQMWFSYKQNDKYLIGYATSADGIQWERLDQQSGIITSVEGWDSEEIEYPFVFRHKGDTYMLYNGNGYGKTGFGIAKLVDNL